MDDYTELKSDLEEHCGRLGVLAVNAIEAQAPELERLRARVAELERVLSLALASLEESLDTVTHEYQTDWRHGMPTRAGQLAAMKQSLDAHHAAIAAARITLETP